MNIVPGEFVNRPVNTVLTTPGWPHAFMKFRLPMEQLFREHFCNHMQVVAGDYVAGLVAVCEKLGIGYKVQDKNLEYEKII